jgi:hypothetical protein
LSGESTGGEQQSKSKFEFSVFCVLDLVVAVDTSPSIVSHSIDCHRKRKFFSLFFFPFFFLFLVPITGERSGDAQESAVESHHSGRQR